MISGFVPQAIAFVGGLAALATVYGLWVWGRSQPQRLSLAETAREAWTATAPRTATLRVEVDDDVAVLADPGKLSAMFEELFENAVTHAGQDVTVELSRTDAGFTVADDGPGIPAAEREAVFDLGFSTQADRNGLGLGLVQTCCHTYDWRVAIAESDAGGVSVRVTDVQFRSTWSDRDETVVDAERPAGI